MIYASVIIENEQQKNRVLSSFLTTALYGPPKGNTEHPAIHHGCPLGDPGFWTALWYTLFPIRIKSGCSYCFFLHFWRAHWAQKQNVKKAATGVRFKSGSGRVNFEGIRIFCVPVSLSITNLAGKDHVLSSLISRAAYMCHWTGSALVQIMACCMEKATLGV